MKEEQEQEAKEMFFKFDGSGFYMANDGVRDEYQRFHVPEDVEAEWLKELTEIKLNQLNSSKVSNVVGFFIHHTDYRHLDAVLRVTPRGGHWEKCGFLEAALEYLGRCVKAKRTTRERMLEVLDSVQSQCAILLLTAKSDEPPGGGAPDESRKRVRRIIEKAETMKRE